MLRSTEPRGRAEMAVEGDGAHDAQPTGIQLEYLADSRRAAKRAAFDSRIGLRERSVGRCRRARPWSRSSPASRRKTAWQLGPCRRSRGELGGRAAEGHELSLLLAIESMNRVPNRRPASERCDSRRRQPAPPRDSECRSQSGRQRGGQPGRSRDRGRRAGRNRAPLPPRHRQAHGAICGREDADKTSIRWRSVPMGISC